MNRRRWWLGVLWLASLLAVYGLRSQSLQRSRSPTATGADGVAAPMPSPAGTAADRMLVRNMADLQGGKRKREIDVPALVAQALSQLRSSGSREANQFRLLHVMAGFADLDGEQLREVLREMERLAKDRTGVETIYAMLFQQWAETDGRAALAYAKERFREQPWFEEKVVRPLLRSWAFYQPDDAWRWLATEKGQDGDDDLRNAGAVFAGFAGNDIGRTVQRLAAMEKDKASIYLNLFSVPGLRTKFLEYTATLPPEQRQQTRLEMVQFGTLARVEPTLAWLRSLPVEEQGPLRERAGMMLLSFSDVRGAEMQLENAAAENKPAIYQRIVERWRDLETAGAWLAKQPPGPELDGARAAYAKRVSEDDPAAALAWAKAVHDENRRSEALRQVYQQWRSRDAAAAEAALDGLGLSAESIQQLKEASAAPAPRRGG